MSSESSTATTTPLPVSPLLSDTTPTNTLSSPAHRTTWDWELPSDIGAFLPKKALANEDGYPAWAAILRSALEYATLWPLVDGTEPPPPRGSDTAALWRRKDAAARGLIFNALALSVAAAPECWAALHARPARRVGLGAIAAAFSFDHQATLAGAIAGAREERDRVLASHRAGAAKGLLGDAFARTELLSEDRASMRPSQKKDGKRRN